ncbi:hypothetical protein PAPYR_9354 [Paratrimastix pyriformis]|uniref:Uncharacterized protein n=1 Tax=Paratrimastix pyriformis TaxID=342808 RepID=A0ABQ8U8K8_9EUKA|nr:hypothetical protein PAPYR_9354 [Paratrimastix pyriformis]
MTEVNFDEAHPTIFSWTKLAAMLMERRTIQQLRYCGYSPAEVDRAIAAQKFTFDEANTYLKFLKEHPEALVDPPGVPQGPGVPPAFPPRSPPHTPPPSMIPVLPALSLSIPSFIGMVNFIPKFPAIANLHAILLASRRLTRSTSSCAPPTACLSADIPWG